MCGEHGFSQCAGRHCARGRRVAVVAKASGKDKAVVAKEGRKHSTALASEVSEGVSKLSRGPSNDGSAGEASSRAVQEPKTKSGKAERSLNGRVCVSKPGLRIFRRYERSSACVGWLWENWQGQNHPALALSGMSNNLQLSTGDIVILFER